MGDVTARWTRFINLSFHPSVGKELAQCALFRWTYDWNRIASVSDRNVILFFNGMWGRPPDFPVDELPGDCEITTDRRYIRDADAVVFHIPSLGSLNRVKKFPAQLWVAWSMECEAHYPMLLDRNFMSRFDLTMTYHRHADVVVPYYGPELRHLLTTPPKPKNRHKLAVFFASGRSDRSGRIAYVRELMRYIDVHSYGRQLRNRWLALDKGRATKLETIADYKFTLSFENAVAPDYVTEKFFDPLIVGSVPVYLGAPNVAEFAPGNRCYIDVSELEGPKALAEYLTALNENDAAYQEYLAWKQRPLRSGFLELLDGQRTHPFVHLCNRIRDLRDRNVEPILHGIPFLR